MPKKKTKIVFGAGTKEITHHSASKHIASKKGRGGKRANKKVSVKC